MHDVSEAVQALVGRMGSHPEEFFSDCLKWQFMYHDTFRDIFTEAEKDVIDAALNGVRRKEFSTLVMTTLLDRPEENTPLWREHILDVRTQLNTAASSYPTYRYSK